ncbi:hypothetical protein, partial [Ilumatobacter sp.]|uniref:hypothetical protein n=1 Tax=Ilumatobacter sp. TaxID=1967498 RepID=UPI003C5BCE74
AALISVVFVACSSSPTAAPRSETPEITCDAEVEPGVVSPRSFGVEPVPAVAPAELPELFDLVDDLGVCIVGVNAIRWDAVEPSPPADGTPRYDWTRLDAVALEAARVGVDLQLTVQVSSTWGTVSTDGSVGAPGSSPVRTEHLEAFDRFIGSMAARYGGEPGDRWEALDEPVLAMLMVGNEIEVPGHWRANGDAEHPATAESYHDLLDRVADIVHIRAPDVEVLRASTNPGTAFDDGPDAATLGARIDQLGPTEAQAFADFQDRAVDPERRYDHYALHANHGADAVFHAGRWAQDRLPEGTGVVIEDMRSTLTATPYVDPWADVDGDGVADDLAAIGADAEGDGLEAASPEVVDFRRAQAAVVSQKALFAAAVGYRAAFVSTLVDFPASYPIIEWRSTGLVDRTRGELRPAYLAYQQVIDMVGGARRVGFEQRSTGMWVATFIASDGRPLAFVWSDLEDVVDLTEVIADPVGVSALPSRPGERGLVGVDGPIDAVPVGPVPVVVQGRPPDR